MLIVRYALLALGEFWPSLQVLLKLRKCWRFAKVRIFPFPMKGDFRLWLNLVWLTS